MLYRYFASGLHPIYFLRFISTVTFGIFYSSLSLLMKQSFNMPEEMATGLASLFFGFHYTLPLIGGKLGDHVKNFKQIFITGKIFQLISSFILIYSLIDPHYLYIGLGFFLVDSMVNVVSLNMLITNRFEQSDITGRNLAFLRGHVWSNIGFVAALLLSGATYHFLSIDSLFYVTATFSFLTIIYCYFFIDMTLECDTKNLVKNNLQILPLMFTVALLMKIALDNYYLTRDLIILSAACLMLVVITKSCIKASLREVSNILIFSLYMLCSIIFWTIYMIGPTFLPLFIDTGVNAVVFGFNVPPQWFHVLCPLTTVTAGTVLSNFLQKKLKKQGSLLQKNHLFMFGLFCATLGLFLLYNVINQHTMGIQTTYWWIISFLIIMALGEICIAPACMALVGEYIPKKYQGIYTGINQMTIGLSVIFSGILSKYFLLPIYTTSHDIIDSYSFNVKYLSIAIIFVFILLWRFDKIAKSKIR